MDRPKPLQHHSELLFKIGEHSSDPYKEGTGAYERKSQSPKYSQYSLIQCPVSPVKEPIEGNLGPLRNCLGFGFLNWPRHSTASVKADRPLSAFRSELT